MSNKPVAVRGSRIQSKGGIVAAVIAAIGVIVAAFVTGGFGLVAPKSGSTVPTQAAGDESNLVSQSVNVKGRDPKTIVSGRDTIIHQREDEPRNEPDPVITEKVRKATEVAAELDKLEAVMRKRLELRAKMFEQGVATPEFANHPLMQQSRKLSLEYSRLRTHFTKEVLPSTRFMLGEDIYDRALGFLDAIRDLHGSAIRRGPPIEKVEKRLAELRIHLDDIIDSEE